MRIHIPPGASGWLVVANAYNPAWGAKVDGKGAKLYPTNFAAMGLPVREGARTVDIEYRRSRVWVGAAVSGAALPSWRCSRWAFRPGSGGAGGGAA